jgi:hypothetical protein
LTKIYTDDPLVHYQNTSISPERSKAEIDALLGYWKVSDIHWHWKPEANDVYIQFLLEEVIDERPIKVAVRVDCPTIWDKERPRARPPQTEQVNWRVSMRALWWYIKTHLEMGYAMQSSKTVAFLPNIMSQTGETLKDVIIPRLNQMNTLKALPTEAEIAEEKRQAQKIVEGKIVTAEEGSRTET